MRRLFALAALVSLLAACTPPPSVAVPSEAPPASAAPTPVEEQPSPSPEAPVPTLAPQPTPNVPPPQPMPVAPSVSVIRRQFAIGSVPAPVTPAADELRMIQDSLPGWAEMLGQLLTRYQTLWNQPPQEQLGLRQQFEMAVAPGPFAEILRQWTMPGAKEGRSFAVVEPTLVRAYAKPWGRASYADLRLKLVEAGGGADTTRDVTVRVQAGRMLRIVDGFDATAGRWLAGEASHYSALALETEVPGAVANYLWNESYVTGGNQQYPSLPGGVDTRFWKARADAIGELNQRFNSKSFVDRHFENVTATIVRFDPASYLGDGVITVSVSGRLVEIAPGGSARQFSFTQQMKFLRSTRGGSPFLAAIDQQSLDGTWDSGGDLALFAVDRDFG